MSMEYFTSFQSTNISKLGYDSSTSTLEVEFSNGGIYQYFDVPEHIWEAFKSCDSKGKFMSESLKGQYRYSKV